MPDELNPSESAQHEPVDAATSSTSVGAQARSPLTTGQAAELCRVNTRTVLRWIKRGELKAYQLPGRGDHRIEPSELARFLRRHGLPVPIGFGGGVPKVLIVDDDVTLARTYALALKPLRAEVRIAGNGFVAGGENERWRPDVVTLDLSMPGLGGLDVLRAMRSAQGHNPRVLVVSAAGEAQLDEALNAGADGAVSKPITPNDLQQAVAHLLEARRHAG